MGRFFFPLLIGVLGAAILVALGVWQVQRLAWKEGVLSEMEARLGGAPVAVPSEPDPVKDRFLPVRATGSFSGDDLHVLISTRELGAAFRIISTFESEDGRRLMVDRGAVPDEAKDAERSGGAAEVSGNLHWPDEVDSFTPEADVAGNIWFARDVSAMAAALGTEPVLIVAREVSGAGDNVTPLPVTTEGIPNDHLQYAITWFGLAFVWIGMTAYWIGRIRRGTG